MTVTEATRTGPSALSGPIGARSVFAHASEAELARIFDFYGVTWEYEPHVFPIQWNLDGAVVESFTPDFFLPDFELYVELTTLRQPLVRKKNRKLRRLRELYPEVRIKLFYARDFRALMLKYGKGALIGALSGTSGQVVPAAQAAPEPVEPAAVAVRLPVGDTEQVPTAPSTRRPRVRRPREDAPLAVIATLQVDA